MLAVFCCHAYDKNVRWTFFSFREQRARRMCPHIHLATAMYPKGAVVGRSCGFDVRKNVSDNFT